MTGMKKLVIIAIALMLLAGTSFAALDATAPVNIHLTAGTLEIADDGTGFVFPDTTLTGAVQKPNLAQAAPVITVTDQEGVAGGWAVNYACPDLLLGGEAQTLASKKLAFNAKSTAAQMTVTSGQTGADAGLVKENASMTNIASNVEFLNAADGKGMGVYTTASKFATTDFEVVVKDVQYAGEYTGTFTATLARGIVNP